MKSSGTGHKKVLLKRDIGTYLPHLDAEMDAEAAELQVSWRQCGALQLLYKQQEQIHR